MTLEGEPSCAASFVQLSHGGPVQEISVHAGPDVALVTDSKVCGRV
jgi:hypothetical protein